MFPVCLLHARCGAHPGSLLSRWSDFHRQLTNIRQNESYLVSQCSFQTVTSFCAGSISLYIIINFHYFLTSSCVSSLRMQLSGQGLSERTKGYRDVKKHRHEGSSNLISLQGACRIMNAYAEDSQLTGRKLNEHIYVINKILYGLDVIHGKA